MLAKIDRSYNKVSRYGSAVGRVMVRETTLLSRQEVERMLYPDYEEALGVAHDTAYGPYLEGASVPADIESGLESFLEEQYRFLEEACSGTLVARFVRMKYDYHNLRVLVKRAFLGGEDAGRLFSKLGVVPVEALEQALNGMDSPDFPADLRGAIERAREAGSRGETDPQMFDSLVDRAFFEGRLLTARQEGSRPLVKYCRCAVDVANLMVMLRGLEFAKGQSFYAAALADGGEFPRAELLSLAGRPFAEVTARFLNSRYGTMVAQVLDEGAEGVRLTSLDRTTDDCLMEKVAGFASVSVGPERIVRYMLTRETEVAILRIVFVGKLNSLSPAVIETRLPLGYLKAGSE